jgi:hypothetical protein
LSWSGASFGPREMGGMPFSTRWMRAASWESVVSGLGRGEAEAIREITMTEINTALLDDLEFTESSVEMCRTSPDLGDGV